jgi:hypothetical protein
MRIEAIEVLVVAIILIVAVFGFLIPTFSSKEKNYSGVFGRRRTLSGR